jgi:hypothetical protein
MLVTDCQKHVDNAYIEGYYDGYSKGIIRGIFTGTLFASVLYIIILNKK